MTGKMLGLLAAMSCLAASLAFAGEIQKGAAMRAKPNSIWFQDPAQFAHWRRLKESGDTKALASYEEKALSSRDAWLFIKPLTVKIIGYEPRESQVAVEMMTAGRLQGTTWLLDAGAVEPLGADPAQ